MAGGRESIAGTAAATETGSRAETQGLSKPSAAHYAKHQGCLFGFMTCRKFPRNVYDGPPCPGFHFSVTSRAGSDSVERREGQGARVTRCPPRGPSLGRTS